MVTDSPLTLCTWDQFTSGAFNDLARNYTDPGAQQELLAESTRLCESAAQRRLVPFTGMVETHRATGIDPDEYPGGGAPMSQQAALGQSYATALGGDAGGVRHVWLNEHATRYPELWTYQGVSVEVTTSLGSTAAATVTGPEADTGHLWFALGTWLPVGSLVRVTYGGGYTVAIPADLQRAGKLMTAALILRELMPTKQTRDPRALWDDAVLALSGYGRD